MAEMNVAVATGADSGIFVIDVDGPEGEDSLSRLEADTEACPTR